MMHHKTLRSLFLAVALAFLAPLTGIGGAVFGVEVAQAQTVSRIVVTGNERVDDSTIQSYLTIRVGEAATNSAIQNSIASLNSTGLFSTVSVRYGSGTLTVAVAENPIVASVLFEGNLRFNDQQLLAMVNLGSRGAYTDERLAGDVRAIENAYDQAGYTNVTVTSRTEVVENSRLRVTFVINEGDKAGIAAINFTGNNTFSAWTLKSVINTKESHLLSWLFQDDSYSEDKLAADKEMIRLFYANRGFPDAQVLSAVAEYDASRNAYFVNFAISEGERYSFGDIGIETSINGLNVDALRGAIRSNSGGTYSYLDVQQSVEDIAYRATGQGYAFADVRARVNRDTVNHVLHITYLVDEGARVYVERINIIGNTKTRDFVIRRQLEFAEGDPFNRAMVTRGKSAIEQLDYFSSVDVTTARGSAADKITINIVVVEKSTGDYGATVGYQTGNGPNPLDGVLGEISLTERNFLGRGQYLRIAVGASTAGQTYDLSFTEPSFMGLDISAGFDVYRRIQDETTTNFYGSNSTGGQVRFGVPVTDDLNVTLLAGGENRNFADCYMYDHDSNSGTPDIPHPTFCGDSVVVADGQTLNKLFVGYTLDYNNIDETGGRPRSGLVAQLSQQYVFLDHNFLKTEVKARYFVPLIPDANVIASVRGQAGIINDFSGGGVHPVEAFHPGQRLVRGFDAGGIGPRAATGEALGATMYAGVSAEIEFPLPMVPENYGLSGAVWADAGWVANVPASQAINVAGGVTQQLRSSVGGSIIWESPFGPLRGDLAYQITRDPADLPNAGTNPWDPFVFQLSLSTLL